MSDIPGPRASNARRSWPYIGLRLVLATSLFAMAAITFVDVIGRYALNAPVPGAYEIVGWLMGIVTFTGIPLISRARSHITVDLFDSFIRGRARKVQQALILAGNAAMLAFFADRLVSSAIEEYRANYVTQYFSVSRAPLLIVFAILSLVASLIVLIMLWHQLSGRNELAGMNDGTEPSDGSML